MNLLLIDTNIIIDALKEKRGRAEYLESLPTQGFTLALCGVVMAELYTGLAQADLQNADGMTRDFVFLPTNRVLTSAAGGLRRKYLEKGISLSITDCLIAATSIYYDVMLVTGNQRHFPMPELRFYPLPRVH